ncbi:PREDICTED: chymotrypsin-1-like [Ceratosolen solmsi marchali]|uniref:Chymotrypsin-1-like n=1 Tax=Ceratosolen solmsi marchali TaxID=326594 RepID=A0AAJ7E1W3_9HYME|nr:PREDICTED: chymotrypsin-1-like [Ceratosolen solmsi marchali]
MDKLNYQSMVNLFAIFTIGALGIFAKDMRIIGGNNTRIYKNPFMASLRYIESNIIFCGGSIISNKHILTAAHCVFRELDNVNSIVVYTGIALTRSTSGWSHTIDTIVCHPEFTGEDSDDDEDSNDEIYVHDLAIITVNEEIRLNFLQNVINLPNREIYDDDSGYVLGWGSTTHPNDTFPVILQKAYMYIYPLANCSEMYDFRLHIGQFCAYNDVGIGPCMGDSGGPFVIDGKIAGIVSFNYPCAHGVPDFYTNVYFYIDFIRNILNS